MIDSSGKSLSSSWAAVQKEDIGAGFRRAATAVKKELLRRNSPRKGKNKRIEDVYHRLKMLNVEAEHRGQSRHPFLNGRNKFIFYVLKPPKVQRVDRKKELEKKAVNYKNKVTVQQRQKFAVGISENIQRTSKFFLDEILPRTQSLYTALDNVDDIMSQLTDGKAELPLDFIRGKARDATHLRIIRFLSHQYGLTKEETRLMAAEYIARSKPQLF